MLIFQESTCIIFFAFMYHNIQASHSFIGSSLFLLFSIIFSEISLLKKIFSLSVSSVIIHKI